MANTQFQTAVPDYGQARQNLVDGQVRTNKVTDHRLIQILRNLPREEFVDTAQKSIAYIDETLTLPGGRFLLQPMIQARMVQELGVQAGEKILDAGCASGYSSAILAQLGADVVAIDRDSALIKQAESLLQSLGVSGCQFTIMPPLDGCAASGPYDAILVNGSVAEPPYVLFDQLKNGGRLICILKEQAQAGLALTQGKAMLYQKSDGVISGRALFDAAAPYLEKTVTRHKFVF